jgi:hypothetical protein
MAVLLGACSAAAADADRQPATPINASLSYQYVSLSEQLPPTMDCLRPAHLGENGVVFGTVEMPPPQICMEEMSPQYVVVYRDGRFTVVAPGRVNTANERGIAGGAVFDEARQAWRAALFVGTAVEQLPLLSPSEVRSEVIELTDSGLALIQSTNVFYWPPRPGDVSYGVYRAGRLTRIDLGPVTIGTPRINNRGEISGTIVGAYPADPAKPDRAFVHDWRSGKTTIFDPQVTDIHSNGRDINVRGEVLGYSMKTYGVPAKIGIWAGHRPFKIWLDEADHGFMSSWLRFNNAGAIVASATDTNKIFLIPRPGALIDVVARTAHFPAGLDWPYIDSITERGDMLGGGLFWNEDRTIRPEAFVLRRESH